VQLSVKVHSPPLQVAPDGQTPAAHDDGLWQVPLMHLTSEAQITPSAPQLF
jgi:hypothetical protein